MKKQIKKSLYLLCMMAMLLAILGGCKKDQAGLMKNCKNILLQPIM